MKITIIVEGKTEGAFIWHLRRFLETRLAGNMPKLDLLKYNGRIPKGDILKRIVNRLLEGTDAADAVIALTDVYTGNREFKNAEDAIKKMNEWVGPNNKFYAHACQYDFEAWLLPYWPDILNLAGSNRKAPGPVPENINHDKPPSYHLQDVFRTGKHRQSYIKVRDAKRILQNQDLLISANQCPQLKAFLNTILTLCGAAPVP